VLKRFFVAVTLLLVSYSVHAEQKYNLKQLAQERQDQFEEIKATFKQLRYEVVISSEFDEQKAKQYAKVRSDQGQTKARSQIWKNWADFVKQMDRYRTASNNIIEPLRYANREDAAMFVNQAAKTCKACHRLYKKR